MESSTAQEENKKELLTYNTLLGEVDVLGPTVKRHGLAGWCGGSTSIIRGRQRGGSVGWMMGER